MARGCERHKRDGDTDRDEQTEPAPRPHTKAPYDHKGTLTIDS